MNVHSPHAVVALRKSEKRGSQETTLTPSLPKCRSCPWQLILNVPHGLQRFCNCSLSTAQAESIFSQWTHGRTIESNHTAFNATPIIHHNSWSPPMSSLTQMTGIDRTDWQVSSTLRHTTPTTETNPLTDSLFPDWNRAGANQTL